MINKVITSLQDCDFMEQINTITGLNIFSTDNWVDIEKFEEHPELKKFITNEEFTALLNGNADYIAFRLDE
ncbi:MAG: hypothetical protein LUH11_04050 [Candidatus Gastranaerophilales bacterium]|nr:hypothetical protein [Candidatus Gastranaerophilales bacterium]